ncbi:MAG: glycosyltransferase family 2 protein [Candidatus Daviesbacteria bacterium]|nr:glycosyltransferase family 2 protein [Candidatus Daviesbacteria bacterium]
MAESPDLSIIILNYNVKDLLLKCLESIFRNKTPKDKWQIIVVDNASEDGLVKAVKEKYNDNVVELVENKENLGFSAGNNVGVKKTKAPVMLFLNPDTIVVDEAIQKTYQFLMGNPDIGAITCRVELPNGKLDYSSHRGFPTPWNAFAYFSGLAKLFPHSSFFAGYTATHLDTRKIHEIDCLTGAFLMVRKIAGDQIGWWDKDYFWNGEDIEFCYSLKEKGWKIYFYPEEKVIHYKGSSSGLWKTAGTKVDKKKRIEAVKHGVSAMRIFYKKHFYNKYPLIIRDLILAGIKLLEHYRKAKLWISQ